MSNVIMEISNLSIALAGNVILKDISLDIATGDYVSIIGPNGAGKTTLIKCMAGIFRQWSGDIKIKGQRFTGYTSRELAKLQSYVPQAEGRFNPLTVSEFVTLGRYPHLSVFTTLKPEDQSVIDNAINCTGLGSLRHRALNTLSGGERQMAFIAAALAQDTEILLLDEPATFLDYRHQAGVANILKRACRENGITIVAVHHDINTAMACSNRIVALKRGAIVFQGTPA